MIMKVLENRQLRIIIVPITLQMITRVYGNSCNDDGRWNYVDVNWNEDGAFFHDSVGLIYDNA